MKIDENRSDWLYCNDMIKLQINYRKELRKNEELKEKFIIDCMNHLHWWQKILVRFNAKYFLKKYIEIIITAPLICEGQKFGVKINGKTYWLSDYKQN